MVGLFINTVPMRLRVSPDAELIPWLQEVRAEHVALRRHQYTPLVQIQEWSELPRGTPLFDNILVFDNYQLDSALRAEGGPWANRSFRLHEKTNYPLSLGAYGGSELLLNLAFMESALDGAAAAQVLRSLRALLEGMALRPHGKLSELPAIAAEDRLRAVSGWNDTRRDYGEGTIHGLFEESVARDPNAVAAELGEDRLTYGELNARANQLAHHLRELGAGPETVVGLSLERSLDAIVAILAIWKSGGAYLPLDPALPEERLRFMLEETGAAFVVTRKSVGSALPMGASRMIFLDGDAAAIGRRPDENLSGGAAENNLAVVLFTSGSTGKPKGVMLPHRGLRNRLLWGREIYRLSEADRVLQVYSISFDFAIWEIFTPLVAGGRVVMAPVGAPQDPSQVTRIIAERSVTMAGLIPSMMDALLEDPGIRNCGCLRIVSLGGDALTGSLARKFRSRLDAELQNAYGPTEASIDVTWWVHRAETRGTERDATIPIGRPNANVRLYVLDPRMSLVPPGVPGELYVGGACLARGYFRRPDLTADGSFRIRSRMPRESVCTAAETSCATARTAAWSSSGASIPRSKCAATASSSVKSRRGWRSTRPWMPSSSSPSMREGGQAARRLRVGPRAQPGRPGVARVSPVTAAGLHGSGRSRASRFLPPASQREDRRRGAPRPGGGRRRNSGEWTNPPERRRRAPAAENLGTGPAHQPDQHPVELLRARRAFAPGAPPVRADRKGIRPEAAARHDLPGADGGEARCDSAPGWMVTGLVLARRDSAGGVAPALFCVHAVGGNVLTYMDLARHMGTDQPVYGLQAQGLDGKRMPHTTIQEMAAHYVSEIVKLQPEGPYHMGGSSAGGIVAFEMAQQLVAQGKQVGVLALFDTWGPGYPKPLPGITAIKKRFFHFKDRVDLHVGNFLVAEGVKEKLAYIVTKSRRLSNNIRRAGHKRWSKLKKLPNALLNPLPRALRNVENMGVRATELYEAEALPRARHALPGEQATRRGHFRLGAGVGQGRPGRGRRL